MGGSAVRRGLLYRSGQHVEASDEDLAALGRLHIRTVIDLRGESERERHPCRRVEGFDGQVIFHEGETSSSPPHLDIDASVTTAAYARERMQAVYTRMPHNPAMIAMFGRYLRVLADNEGPSLVHCFAGKDRTGVAAMLVLHLLGVSREDQIAEFMRTNDAPTIAVLRRQTVPALEERFGRTLDEPSIDALLGVREEYLETWWAEAERMHGSLDDYVSRELGVDDDLRQRLQARYVT